MFDAIASGDMSRLTALGHEFSIEDAHFAAAFLCNDHVFSTPVNFESRSTADVLTFLCSFSTYTRHLRRLALQQDACNNISLQKLLAFTELGPERYLVQPGTLLAAHLMPAADSTSSGAIETSRQDLNFAICEVLKNRLLARVKSENSALRLSKITNQPCMRFIADVCRYETCDRPHIMKNDFPSYHEERVHIVLAQINVYESVSRIEYFLDYWEQQR